MAKIFKLGFKRKRKHITNYHKRFALVKGTFERIAIRRSNKRISAQIIKYEEKGDLVLASAYSEQLSKYGWPARSNKATAYLTGLLLAKDAKQKKLLDKEYILDIGLSAPVKNSVPFVFAQGCIDGGLKLRSGAKLDEKTYNASSSYATYIKDDKEKYEKHFGGYIKQKIKPEELSSTFKIIKEKILNE